jgi:septal ring factor EnvC (AmiA/AmiB activator)
MTAGDNEKDERMFLPGLRGITPEEEANAYLRLAVIHKMQIPDARERNAKTKGAKARLENTIPLSEFKDMRELEKEIKNIKQKIHGIKRQIKQFTRSGDEKEEEEKALLLSEKISKQDRLKKLEKFLGMGIPELPDSIQKTKQEIQELETKIALFEGSGYEEKARLETERGKQEERLKTLEKFRQETNEIVYWHESLQAAKKAILTSKAIMNSYFLAKNNPHALKLANEIYESLIQIENE